MTIALLHVMTVVIKYRTTAEHYYRRSHRVCSQLAIAQLQNTTTGAVTGCVPNWRSHNCRTLLQVQSRLCSQLAIATLLAASPIYPNQKWHRPDYVSIAYKNEDGCLLRCDVLQPGRPKQTFRRNFLDSCSEQKTGVWAGYPKRRYWTHTTVQVCNSNLCRCTNPTSSCFLIKYVSTLYPSMHATHPVHIILILCLISYDGRDVLLCRWRHSYPCALWSTTPLRCTGEGVVVVVQPHIFLTSALLHVWVVTYPVRLPYFRFPVPVGNRTQIHRSFGYVT